MVHYGQSINIITDNIKFCEAFICFGNDLLISKSVDNMLYCWYLLRFKHYKNNLDLKHKGKNVHLIEELEIYKLIHV